MAKRMIVFCMVFILLIIIKTEARIMYRSPEFVGKVIDVTTGKPVEQAIITVDWQGFGKGLMSSNDIFKRIIIITDKEGNYKIPGDTSFHLFSTISRVMITVNHPLYVDINFQEIVVFDDKNSNVSYSGTKQSDGVMRYDIKVMGLEEAMKSFIANEKIEIEKNSKFVSRNRPSAIGGYSAAWFKNFKEKHRVRYDLNNIWDKWVQLTLKYYGINLYEVMKFNNNTKKIKEDIDQLMKDGY